MFKSSEFLDEESVQAIRLDESLDKLIFEGQSDIDSREDPELSELLALGAALRDSADDVTNNRSFKMFHMRSRASVLRTVAEARENKGRSRLIDILNTFVPTRSSILPTISASAVTFVLVMFVGGNLFSSAETSVDNSSVRTSESVSMLTVPVVTVNNGRARILLNQFTDVPPNIQESSEANLAVGAAQRTPDFITIDVQSVKFDRLQYSRRAAESVAVVTQDIQRSLDVGQSVTRDQLFDLTSGLAALGNGIRLDPPGAHYEADLATYQDIMTQAFVIVHLMDSSSDPSIQGAITAAKVVAEDSMLIAARYVNSNNILHYD